MDVKFYDPAFFSFNKIRNRGSNAGSTLRQNRSLILRLIKDTGVISRKELAERTGLKLATITIVINEFLKAGIIEKAGLIDGDSGRKVMGFRFMCNRFCTIAVRLSVSYLKIGLYDINTNNLFIKKIFFNTMDDINFTCDKIVEEIEEIKPIIGKMQVLGIGVAVESPFILKDGLYMLPYEKSPSGYFDIGSVLHKKTGYSVLVNRENNYSVYKTWKTEHEKKELGIIIHIIVSYVIECGIMINGEIVNGDYGAAGLLGKTAVGYDEKGNIITLDDEIASSSIVKRALKLLPKYPNSILVSKRDDLNIRDVINGFHLDDELATLLFTEAGILLGRSVAKLVNLLNPDLIVIGDELPISEKMYAIIDREARRHISGEICLNFKLIPSDPAYARESKMDPVLLGASFYITDAFLESMDFGE